MKTLDMKLIEKELYQEIDLIDGHGNLIGTAEVDIKGKMLSRLNISDAYQGKGYGTEAVMMLTEKYNLDNLWVETKNEKAIHVYEKCGYVQGRPTMIRMERKNQQSGQIHCHDGVCVWRNDECVV